MSTTLAAPRASVSVPASPSTLSEPPSRRAPGDRVVLALLALCFAGLAALTWRKWGVPEIDAGAELTTADLIKHGAVAYRDVRYYYGPLGLYSLALSFRVLGTGFTTAFAFGLVQTAAILAVFYALARQWLVPLVAGLATAVLLAIGFSGSTFNFILPHTDSATFGVLCLLLMLLALARERALLAGLAAGLVALTRPEFLAVAAGAGVAYAVATWRVSGRARAWSVAWRLALPAIVVPVVVLGLFAEQAGLSKLVTENLWPVKFLHGGVGTEKHWAPFDLSSLMGLLGRGTLYGGLLAAVVASVTGWRARRQSGAGFPSRLFALWPLAAAVVGIALLDGALRASGVLAGQRTAIELEARHLVLGMSWLPALGLAVAALAAVRFVRGQSSPLGRSWPADLALIVAAAGLGLRAYNAFTTEGSYAPYYAAPLVLVLSVLHERVAARWPQARIAVLGVLGLVAAGLAAYALGGLYVHDTATVRTPRGTFVTSASAASRRAGRGRADRLAGRARPTDPRRADRGRPVLHVRPPPGARGADAAAGTAGHPAEQTRRRSQDCVKEALALAVIAARNLSVWSTHTFGVDYDTAGGAYLRRASISTTIVGSLTDPVGGTIPSKGFTIRSLSTIVRLR